MTTNLAEIGYDILTPPKEVYAYVHLPEAGWNLAARLTVRGQDIGRPVAELVYARSWRDRKDGFEFDPINLPLIDGTHEQRRMIGTLEDACPDRWGRHLLAERFARLQDEAVAANPNGKIRKIPTDFDTLLLSGDDRCGALAFGPTRNGPVLLNALVPIRNLAEMEEKMVQFDDGMPVEADIARMAAGTALGGARPKCTVRLDDGSLWIAKFRRSDDSYDVIRCEHAMMTLASKAGVEVPETRVVSLGKREALLVRRFDREYLGGDSYHRIPFVSAMSLLKLSMTDDGGSYMEVADHMRRATMPVALLSDLYRRMLVNIACGNTDDHLKNHGFLRLDNKWTLAPAYDIVPQADGDDFQAISVGRYGRTANFDNALSAAPRFGLDEEGATAIAQEVAETMENWQSHFVANGVSDADIRRLSRCIGRLDMPSTNPALRR
jgi:serine/threonine-protein kinase HipA